MDFSEFTGRTEELAYNLAVTVTAPLNTILLSFLKRPAELKASRVWANLIYNTALAWKVPLETVVPLQVATRLLILSADLLDDVVDNDVATPEELGLNVNAGAALLSLAQLALLDLPEPLPALSRLNQTTLSAFAGQQFELDLNAKLAQHLPLAVELQTGPAPANTDETLYLEQAWLKTGGPLAAVCICAAEQGQALSDIEIKSLQDFGLNFGLVLQIKNDLESFQPDTTKKSDLNLHKISLPLIYLKEKVSPTEYTPFLEPAPAGTPTSRDEFWQFLAKCGALDYARVISEMHLFQARQALQATESGMHLDRLLFEQNSLKLS